LVSDQGETGRLEDEIARLRSRLGELEEGDGLEPAAFLRSVLAAAPAFIVFVDREMRMRFVNRVQPGLTMNDVIGRSLFDFIAARDVEVARACVERVLETGEIGHYSSVGTGPNGLEAHYETHVAPVNDSGGGLCVLAFDVTEHRRREERSARANRSSGSPSTPRGSGSGAGMSYGTRWCGTNACRRSVGSSAASI
jgi:PAS domain S-box-containing protein